MSNSRESDASIAATEERARETSIPAPESPSPSLGLENIRDTEYYSDTCIFLVEQTLFKLPLSAFLEQSQVFRDMFQFPPGDGPAEGQDDKNPIILEGVKVEELKVLLHVLYPKRMRFESGHPVNADAESLTFQNWMDVYHLAKRWLMQETQVLACQCIDNVMQGYKRDPIAKIGYARTCKRSDWLLDAYFPLANQMFLNQYLSEDLAKWMGWETAYKLMKASMDTHSPTTRSGRGYSKEELRKYFQEEVDALDSALKGGEGIPRRVVKDA